MMRITLNVNKEINYENNKKTIKSINRIISC